MSHGAPIHAAALPAWEQYLEKNFKKLLLLFIAVVVVLSVYGATRYFSHAAAVKAGEAFAAAKTVEDLDVVIASHKGTAAAGNALLQKADLLWEQNKKTTSVEALREFVKSHSGHPLMPQALLGLATKVESLGQRAEAKPVFEQIVSQFGKSELAALAELRLGDIAWAEGKEDEAKKIYEGLPAKHVGSADNPFLAQGESRLEWIAAKLPTKEVDGPPKPKVETPAPGAPPIPGMPPQFKLNSTDGKALSPTISPTAAGDAASTPINLSPAGVPTAPMTITPSTPAPASASIELKPAPAPAPTAPAAPATPAVEVKPAPATPAPAAPAPAAPVPAAKPANQ